MIFELDKFGFYIVSFQSGSAADIPLRYKNLSRGYLAVAISLKLVLFVRASRKKNLPLA